MNENSITSGYQNNNPNTKSNMQQVIDIKDSSHKSDVKLISKKFKTYGIELTFRLAEKGNHELHIELNDDCGSIIDIYQKCFSEFLIVITPISEQRRLRIVINENDEMLYQITMRIPAHYKQSDEFRESREVSNEEVDADTETNSPNENEMAIILDDKTSNSFINGDLEVDFSSISEKAVKMIDFKR